MIEAVFIPVRRCGRIVDYAWVDAVDAPRVLQYGWVCGGIHAVASGRRDRSVPPMNSVPMHRFVLGLARGDRIVHHINEDPRDNRRRNLKIVADLLAHGSEPHPRRDQLCSIYVTEKDLPPHERVQALAQSYLIHGRADRLSRQGDGRLQPQGV